MQDICKGHTNIVHKITIKQSNINNKGWLYVGVALTICQLFI